MKFYFVIISINNIYYYFEYIYLIIINYGIKSINIMMDDIFQKLK